MIDHNKLRDAHAKWEWLIDQLASNVPSVTDEMPVEVVDGLMTVVRHGCISVPFTWMRLLAWGIDMTRLLDMTEFRNFQLSPTLEIARPHGLQPHERFTHTFFGHFGRTLEAPVYYTPRFQVDLPANAYERCFLDGLAAAEKVMHLLPLVKLPKLFEVLLNCAPTLHALSQLATTEFRTADGTLHLLRRCVDGTASSPRWQMSEWQKSVRKAVQRILDGAVQSGCSASPTRRDNWKASFADIDDTFNKLPFLQPDFQLALARIDLPAYEDSPKVVAERYKLHLNTQCSEAFLHTTLCNEAVIERVPHLLAFFHASAPGILTDIHTQETVEQWVQHISGQDKSSGAATPYSLDHLFFVVFRDWKAWCAASPVAIDTLTKKIRGLSSLPVAVLLQAVRVAGDNNGFAVSPLFTEHLYRHAIEETLLKRLNVNMVLLSDSALEIFRNLTTLSGDNRKVASSLPFSRDAAPLSLPCLSGIHPALAGA
jgi:hypothetical protein